MVSGARGIKDRMLDRTIEFNDILFFDSESFLSKFIEGFLVGSLAVELLPAAAQHDLRTLGKLKSQAPFLQDPEQEKCI